MSNRSAGSTYDVRAHNLVHRAVVAGLIVRPERCENPTCRSDGGPNKHAAIEAHHDDYNRPFDVRWLCKSCHTKWHAKHRAVPARPGLDYEPFEARLRVRKRGAILRRLAAKCGKKRRPR